MPYLRLTTLTEVIARPLKMPLTSSSSYEYGMLATKTSVCVRQLKLAEERTLDGSPSGGPAGPRDCVRERRFKNSDELCDRRGLFHARVPVRGLDRLARRSRVPRRPR